MLHALGSAGTQAAGLWEFIVDGSMSKHLHPGKAAFNGVLAADLAREGFTGAARILEGDRGFFRAMSTGADPARVTDGLGTVWKIGENGYKLYSCCGHTHTAIDVALDLRQQRGWSSDQAVERGRLDRNPDLRSGIRHRQGDESAVAVPGQVQPCLLRRGGPARRGSRARAICTGSFRSRWRPRSRHHGVAVTDSRHGERSAHATIPRRVAGSPDTRPSRRIPAAGSQRLSARQSRESGGRPRSCKTSWSRWSDRATGADAAMAALAAVDMLPHASDMATVFSAILPTHATA